MRTTTHPYRSPPLLPRYPPARKGDNCRGGPSTPPRLHDLRRSCMNGWRGQHSWGSAAGIVAAVVMSLLLRTLLQGSIPGSIRRGEPQPQVERPGPSSGGDERIDIIRSSQRGRGAIARYCRHGCMSWPFFCVEPLPLPLQLL